MADPEWTETRAGQLLREAGEFTMFTDAMPSEQLDGDPTRVLTVAATACTARRNDFVLQPFKKYRGQARRLKAAVMLNQRLDAMFNLRVVGCFARLHRVEALGTELLAQVPAHVGRVAGNKFMIMGHAVPLGRAKVFAWYAIALTMMSSKLGAYGTQLGAASARFSLDPLPGDHVPLGPQPGMALLKGLADHTPLLELWHRTQRETGVSPGFGYGAVRMPDGAFTSAKEEADFAIADWFAQSVYAASNSAEFIRTKGYDEEGRRRIAEPVFSLLERKQAHLVALERAIQWS